MEPLNITVQISSTSSSSFLILNSTLSPNVPANLNDTSLPVSEQTNTNSITTENSFYTDNTATIVLNTTVSIGVSVTLVMN